MVQLMITQYLLNKHGVWCQNTYIRYLHPIYFTKWSACYYICNNLYAENRVSATSMAESLFYLVGG
jgi:hypothetical protein